MHKPLVKVTSLDHKPLAVKPGRGVQYVDRHLTVDLKGTVGRSHDINTLADSSQCKSSE